MTSVTRIAVLVLAGACGVVGCKNNDITSTTNNNSNTFGPGGGTAKGANGEELIIPPGALSTTVTFSLSVAQPGSGSYPESLPAGQSTGGYVFEITPHGTQFSTPATVLIPYMNSGGTLALLQAEEGATSWTPLAITANNPISGATSASLEGAVSALSYFTVAYSSSADAAPPGGCSGRAPVSGAPAGTITNFTGTFTESGQTLDLTQIKDGYASTATGIWVLNFTNYANACGYLQNNDIKIGGALLRIGISSTPDVQTYPANMLQGVGLADPSGDAGAGECNPMTPSLAAGAMYTGTGLTINAIDSTHVQGSFSITPGGGPQISGTFDVPVSSATTCTQGTVTPECCIQ